MRYVRRQRVPARRLHAQAPGKRPRDDPLHVGARAGGSDHRDGGELDLVPRGIDGEVVVEMPRAFVYRWRLWSIAEWREAMLEVGFGSVEVYQDTNMAAEQRPVAVSDPKELGEDWIVLMARGRDGPGVPAAGDGRPKASAQATGLHRADQLAAYHSRRFHRRKPHHSPPRGNPMQKRLVLAAAGLELDARASFAQNSAPRTTSAPAVAQPGDVAQGSARSDAQGRSQAPSIKIDKWVKG